MMNVYTYYTDSHEGLYKDWFMPTLPATLSCVSKKLPQDCPSGEFNADGFNLTMRKKVGFILDIIDQEWGNTFLFSDVDVQFFSPDLTHDLETYEVGDEPNQNVMVCMDDVLPCAGFWYARATPTLKSLWMNVYNLTDRVANDQIALWAILHSYPQWYRVGLFPRMQYLNYNHIHLEYYSRIRNVNYNSHNVWNGTTTDEFSILSDNSYSTPLVHHANYTVGMSNKIKLMEIVRNAVNSRKA